MKLEPVSLFAGAALLGLTLVATGAVQTPSSRTAVPIPAPATFGGPLTVKGIPTPDQLVRLSKPEGDLPYLVPAGKVLVITRAGLKDQNCAVLAQSSLGVQRITFDGACVWSFFHDARDGAGGEQHYTFGTNLGPGIAAPEGTIVDVSGQFPANGGLTVLLGYLADA